MTGAVFNPDEKPLVLTKDEFLQVLADLARWIEEGDSMEGFLKYQWSVQPGMYDVSAVLRNGNSMGQGGVRMIRDMS